MSSSGVRPCSWHWQRKTRSLWKSSRPLHVFKRGLMPKTSSRAKLRFKFASVGRAKWFHAYEIKSWLFQRDIAFQNLVHLFV